MYYLAIDTTNKYLIISIFNDEKILYFNQQATNRNVSEITNVEISKAMELVNLRPTDLNGIVVTKGPGSFTGVRIGLTIAKVMASTLNIPMYTLSSMQFYSGISSKNVILDARSKKAFVGTYDKGAIISEQHILLTELSIVDNLIGDLSIIGKDTNYGRLDENFLLLKQFWNEESAFDAKPEYLKENI